MVPPRHQASQRRSLVRAGCMRDPRATPQHAEDGAATRRRARWQANVAKHHDGRHGCAVAARSVSGASSGRDALCNRMIAARQDALGAHVLNDSRNLLRGRIWRERHGAVASHHGE